MLEVRPLALGVRKARAFALRPARLGMSGSISPRIGNSIPLSWLFATRLESHRCQILSRTLLESHRCKKIGGAPPLAPNYVTLDASFRADPTRTNGDPQFAGNSSRICTCEITGVKPSLESTHPGKMGLVSFVRTGSFRPTAGGDESGQ
jgi:hypothetical protein